MRIAASAYLTAQVPVCVSSRDLPGALAWSARGITPKLQANPCELGRTCAVQHENKKLTAVANTGAQVENVHYSARYIALRTDANGPITFPGDLPTSGKKDGGLKCEPGYDQCRINTTWLSVLRLYASHVN
jgi:hypothetical protein